MSTRRTHLVTSIVVTHDMRTARKVADRVVMFFPRARLAPEESQIIYDGPPSDLDKCRYRRVGQFIHGEAGERLMELREAREAAVPNP
jgi:phospholipid/cholesterol/gamma-HCH transport system ATP-binding protein